MFIHMDELKKRITAFGEYYSKYVSLSRSGLKIFGLCADNILKTKELGCGTFIEMDPCILEKQMGELINILQKLKEIAEQICDIADSRRSQAREKISLQEQGLFDEAFERESVVVENEIAAAECILNDYLSKMKIFEELKPELTERKASELKIMWETSGFIPDDLFGT
ncbi:uncharacterized protein MONOS_3155 [Monocercomonoides exilis]|uniref:uncharacterized protein n=1 Tax=Monocercomonoides exilis TaxID=2049356 RepID=UPI00355A4D66|nr:hypothetical protein MONOS_3155 [Monocercomonoides exilis]|eukprot:MONOS_3155.1-p1 / transcript=MONOS_3155.1 / gene=MONOS_3155 / organism=Monocercomonoides_exilis_PA203 / gene_product=unspecified product / transcript_product=unspecified product / location=Mono_scaffold00072:32009-33321(-) / protein_length=168 / sequence_SO=supercontig / SO=protein_coding / is_pseudo=false